MQSGELDGRQESAVSLARPAERILCCSSVILRAGLHFTYPKDRKAAHKHRHMGESVRLQGHAPPPAGLEQGERQPLDLFAAGAGEEEERRLLEFEVDPAELQRLFPSAEVAQGDNGS